MTTEIVSATRTIPGETVANKRISLTGAILGYLTAYRRHPVGFVAICLLLTLAVVFMEVQDAQQALRERASLSVLQLRAEAEHEDGPRYVWALAVHRDLLEKAIADLTMRKNKGLMVRWFGNDTDYEALLKDARNHLAVTTTDEDQARAAIEQASDALERASHELDKSVSPYRWRGEANHSYYLTSSQKREVYDSFIKANAIFTEEAERFVNDPTPDRAEHACMQSRITAFSARLGWPEIGKLSGGRDALEQFLVTLSKVRQATEKLGQLLSENEGESSPNANRLKQFALSQQHRFDIWRARLDKDDRAVRNIFLVGRK